MHLAESGRCERDLASRAFDSAERLAKAARLPTTDVACFRELLAAPPGVRGGRSALNADGSPVQTCVTIRRERWDVRLIGDPAHELAEPLERNAAAFAAAEKLARERAPALQEAPVAESSTPPLARPGGSEGQEAPEVNTADAGP